MSEARNNTIKIKNNPLAIRAAVPAIAKKPNAAEINATIRNISDQLSITNLSLLITGMDYR